MNKNTNKAKRTHYLAAKILIVFALILLFGAAQASILGSVTADKKSLGENEVTFLSVKLMNDSEIELKNVYLRVQGDEGVVFYDATGETTIFIKTIDSIKPNEVKELIIKAKATSIKNPKANVYAYFGTENNLTQAAVTLIETKAAAVEVKGTPSTKSANGIDTATVDFTLQNVSTKSIYKVSAEALAPKDFEVKTQPIFTEKVLPNGVMKQNFDITIPIEATGEKKIIIAYGYFDDTNSPHYFENEYTFDVQKTNYPLIALIGIIVLVVAAYLFFGKGKSSDIKGTNEKAQDEKKHPGKK